MGGRKRIAGYTGHVPLCASFGADDPFAKQRLAPPPPGRRMTQDNVPLRLGMSSKTSYAAVARAVEQRHRLASAAAAGAAAAGLPALGARSLAAAPGSDASLGRARESPPAPPLHEDLFGCSPRGVKLVAGFCGHRPRSAFVVGEVVNAAPHDEWRAHVFSRERAEHHAVTRAPPGANYVSLAASARASSAASARSAARKTLLF